MWDWIVNILFELLKLIQTFAVDWGLSIIILVVIIRLLLTPLMLKSTKSTARMQVLQPKMLEIQERYADDPQRQAEEMQKFYSENKFNPLAGCLPLSDSDAHPVSPCLRFCATCRSTLTTARSRSLTSCPI